MNPQDTPIPGSSDNPPEPPVSPQPQIIGPQQSTGTPSVQPVVPGSTFGATTFGGDAPTPPIPPVPAKKRMPGKKLLVVVCALLVFGLSGGVFAYVQIMNNSPEKVLADALSGTMADLLDHKPSQAIGTMTVESKEAGQPFKMKIDMDAKQAGSNGQLKAVVDFAMGELQFSVTATTVSEGAKTFYLKFDNLQKTFDQITAHEPETAAMAEVYKPAIQKLDGKWIKIDEQGLADMGFTTTETDFSKCTDALEKLRISKDDQKQIKEIFTTHQFAIASEELPSESVEGDTSFHYKLDMNEEAAVHFTKKLIELPSFATVKKDCKIEQKDLDETIDDIKKDVERQTDKEVATKPVFELWVSKNTRRPTKFKVTFDDKEVSFEDITVVKIDAPNITVEIPQETIDLKEVMQLMGQPSGAAGEATLGWSDIREQVLTQ